MPTIFVCKYYSFYICNMHPFEIKNDIVLYRPSEMEYLILRLYLTWCNASCFVGKKIFTSNLEHDRNADCFRADLYAWCKYKKDIWTCESLVCAKLKYSLGAMTVVVPMSLVAMLRLYTNPGRGGGYFIKFSVPGFSTQNKLGPNQI